VGRDVAFSIGVASVEVSLLNHPRRRATKTIENSECMRCWIIKGFGGGGCKAYSGDQRIQFEMTERLSPIVSAVEESNNPPSSH
jgi:hypothetical protein